MLGEPSTPSFCIAAFRSSEPNQVRAFATSATSWRTTTSFGSSALWNTIRDACREAALLVVVVTLTPCLEVLDLEVEGQVFVRVLRIRHRNFSKYCGIY